jgi:hypothetical protein
MACYAQRPTEISERSPASVNLSIPTNYQEAVSVRVSTGSGTEVNNLRLGWGSHLEL